MADEMWLRRADLLPGVQVCLADGRSWTLPRPIERKMAEGAVTFGPEYVTLVAAVAEAEVGGEEERLRAELAFGIFLLARNYNLAPADYWSLLSFPSGSRGLPVLQEALHEVASAHIREAIGSSPGSQSSFQFGPQGPDNSNQEDLDALPAVLHWVFDLARNNLAARGPRGWRGNPARVRPSSISWSGLQLAAGTSRRRAGEGDPL